MYIKPQINKKPRRVVHIWSKANWDSIKEDTRTFCSSFLVDAPNRSLEENWGCIVNHFTTMRSKYIPSKLSSSRYNMPWLSGELRRLCRKKMRYFRRAKRTKSPVHRNAFKKIQNEVRSALNKAHWSHLNSILTEGLELGDNKPFWSYIKSQRQDTQGVSPLRKRGQLHSDAPTKANILSEQFKSVFTKDDPHTSTKQLPGAGFPHIPPLAVEQHGIEKLLRALNPKKASGPDEIPARMLQALSVEIAPALTAFFQMSINAGEVSSQWKKAWITPVFKKGGRAEAANY